MQQHYAIRWDIIEGNDNANLINNIFRTEYTYTIVTGLDLPQGYVRLPETGAGIEGESRGVTCTQ